MKYFDIQNAPSVTSIAMWIAVALATFFLFICMRVIRSQRKDESTISEGVLRQPFTVFALASLGIIFVIAFALLALLLYKAPGLSGPSSASEAISTLFGVPVALSGSMVAILLAKRSVDDAKQATEIAARQERMEQTQYLLSFIDDAMLIYSELATELSVLRAHCLQSWKVTAEIVQLIERSPGQTDHESEDFYKAEAEIVPALEGITATLQSIRGVLLKVHCNPITLSAWELSRQETLGPPHDDFASKVFPPPGPLGYKAFIPSHWNSSQTLTALVNNTQAIIDNFTLKSNKEIIHEQYIPLLESIRWTRAEQRMEGSKGQRQAETERELDISPRTAVPSPSNYPSDRLFDSFVFSLSHKSKEGFVTTNRYGEFWKLEILAGIPNAKMLQVAVQNFLLLEGASSVLDSKKVEMIIAGRSPSEIIGIRKVIDGFPMIRPRHFRGGGLRP